MYITFKIHPKQTNTNKNFADLYKNLINTPNNIPEQTFEPTEKVYYHTRFLENFDFEKIWRTYDIPSMIRALSRYHQPVLNLLKPNMQEYYDTFYIPKHSGGLRRIDAPKSELMNLLRDIKNVFEKDLKVLYHDAAYAYVPERSTLDALTVHQKNESKWFLKLDVKDFFPSCTHKFIMQQLEQIFPFKLLFAAENTKALLSDIIKLCLLNNKLPQGTPMSPMLTNLIMIPLDYTIKNTFKNFDNNYFVYTRYADDILISSKYNFNFKNVEKEINKIFKSNNAPFKIKKEKTRYGSASGRNWNLGLMLNKDNNITIGYQKKQRLKATIFTFMQDFTNNNLWSIIDTQVMIGNISYYSKIEPEYITYLLDKYSTKFGIDFKTCVKRILKGEITEFLNPA